MTQRHAKGTRRECQPRNHGRNLDRNRVHNNLCRNQGRNQGRNLVRNRFGSLGSNQVRNMGRNLCRNLDRNRGRNKGRNRGRNPGRSVTRKARTVTPDNAALDAWDATTEAVGVSAVFGIHAAPRVLTWSTTSASTRDATVDASLEMMVIERHTL